MADILKEPQNREIRTYFAPREAKVYLEILGAKAIDKDNYIFNGQRCYVDVDENTICFEQGIPVRIKNKFNTYGVENCFFFDSVLNLEGLVFLDICLRGENIKECFQKNLLNARKTMLSRIVEEREQIDFKGIASVIDNITTPFLRDNFDIDKFLEECVFNTTGYYKKDGYDKCLKIEWKRMDDLDTAYFIFIDKDGYRSGISNKDGTINWETCVDHNTFCNKEKVTFNYKHNGENINIVCKLSQGNDKNEVKFDKTIDYGKLVLQTISSDDLAELYAFIKYIQSKDISFEKVPKRQRKNN